MTRYRLQGSTPIPLTKHARCLVCGAWQALASWQNVSNTWGVPLFFGEFGAINDPLHVRCPVLIAPDNSKTGMVHAWPRLLCCFLSYFCCLLLASTSCSLQCPICQDRRSPQRDALESRAAKGWVQVAAT